MTKAEIAAELKRRGITPKSTPSSNEGLNTNLQEVPTGAPKDQFTPDKRAITMELKRRGLSPAPVHDGLFDYTPEERFENFEELRKGALRGATFGLLNPKMGKDATYLESIGIGNKVPREMEDSVIYSPETRQNRKVGEFVGQFAPGVAAMKVAKTFVPPILKMAAPMSRGMIGPASETGAKLLTEGALFGGTKTAAENKTLDTPTIVSGALQGSMEFGALGVVGKIFGGTRKVLSKTLPKWMMNQTIDLSSTQNEAEFLKKSKSLATEMVRYGKLKGSLNTMRDKIFDRFKILDANISNTVDRAVQKGLTSKAPKVPVKGIPQLEFKPPIIESPLTSRNMGDSSVGKGEMTYNMATEPVIQPFQPPVKSNIPKIVKGEKTQGEFYHVTDPGYEKSISEKGLIPQFNPPLSQDWIPNIKGTYSHETLDAAKRNAAEYAEYSEGENLMILKVNFPKGLNRKFIRGEEGELVFKDKIPPEWIVKVDPITGKETPLVNKTYNAVFNQALNIPEEKALFDQVKKAQQETVDLIRKSSKLKEGKLALSKNEPNVSLSESLTPINSEIAFYERQSGQKARRTLRLLKAERNDFIAKHGANGDLIDVGTAQRIKRERYKMVKNEKNFDKDMKKTPTGDMADRLISRGLRNQLAKSVPELKPLNREYEFLSDVLEQLAQAKRGEFKSGGWIDRGLTLVRPALESTGSRTAVGLNRTFGRNKMFSPPVLRAGIKTARVGVSGKNFDEGEEDEE